MSGGEKFKMGYNIANASMDIAIGIRPHQRDRNCTGRNLHYPNYSGGDEFAECKLSVLGEKR